MTDQRWVSCGPLYVSQCCGLSNEVSGFVGGPDVGLYWLKAQYGMIVLAATIKAKAMRY